MGVVMMTGIMAVFEMGLSLTGQSLVFDPLPPLEQENSMNKLKELDESLLGLLHQKHEVDQLDPLGSLKDSPLRSSALCDQVLCRINRPGEGYCLGEKKDDDRSPPQPVKELSKLVQSVHPPEKEWSNACALDAALETGQYRFLIRSDFKVDKDLPYRMYSCALKYEGLEPDLFKCNFETSL